MGKVFISNDVICPFYRCETPADIKCEGVQAGTAIHLTFGNRGELKAYRDCKCKGEPERCLIFAGLMRNYEK